jgi:GAF domain-containing protein
VSTGAADEAVELLLEQELFERSPVGLALLAADLTCVRVNPALARRLGLAPEDCRGRPVTELAGLPDGLEDAFRELQASPEQVHDVSIPGASWQLSLVRLGARDSAGGYGLVVTESSSSAARGANRRLAVLSRTSELFSAALDVERTAIGLAEIFVPAFAEHIVVDMVEEPLGFRRLLIHDAEGPPPAGWTAPGELIDYPPEHPSRRAATERSTVVVDMSDGMVARLSPSLESQRTSEQVGLRCAMAVPLVAGDRVVGVVGLASSTEGRFTPDDVALASEVGRRAGAALEAARIYEAERDAHRLAEVQRVAAEASAGRLSRLVQITSELSQARTVQQVAQVVITAAADLLNADNATLIHVSPDGQTLELIASTGIVESVRQRFVSFPVSAELPASTVFRSGEPEWWGSLVDRDTRYPALVGIPATEQSMALLPLQVHERRLGVLTLGWYGPRAVEEQEQVLVQSVASQCAQALHRAALLESERAALAEA